LIIEKRKPSYMGREAHPLSAGGLEPEAVFRPSWRPLLLRSFSRLPQARGCGTLFHVRS